MQQHHKYEFNIASINFDRLTKSESAELRKWKCFYIDCFILYFQLYIASSWLSLHSIQNIMETRNQLQNYQHCPIPKTLKKKKIFLLRKWSPVPSNTGKIECLIVFQCIQKVLAVLKINDDINTLFNNDNKDIKYIFRSSW